ncbi:MAG TPA: radical SAM family heme chaperone HemW [Deltaproteobacteria bacterium]|nr:radical SAM family heme chaperone HemW [Deltaproteobacteria bacterium]
MNTGRAHIPGLYIHFPFCRSKCGYCDFYSVTGTSLVPSFLEALSTEAALYRGEFTTFDTVYLGGGTPSLMRPEQVDALLVMLRGTFAILDNAEITMELNPADLTREDLRALYQAGVNRVNIGVQSFHDQKLQLMGRRHDRRQALSAIEEAAAAGFDNIGLDLIYNLPHQSLEDWRASLEQAIALHPAHLSCYELELKPDTPLGRKFGRGECAGRSEDLAREFFMETSKTLEEAGYIHYEVSNFAAGMGRASRHNRKYWDHTPYLGLGPAAHSFEGTRRWWNRSSLKGYLTDLSNRKRPVEGQEDLRSEELAMEALFLGLRTKEGIDLDRYVRLYGRDLMRENRHQIEEWSRLGLVEISGGHIRPTRSGMAVADALAMI